MSEIVTHMSHAPAMPFAEAHVRVLAMHRLAVTKLAARYAGYEIVESSDPSKPMLWLAENYDGRQNVDDPWSPYTNIEDATLLALRLSFTISTSVHHGMVLVSYKGVESTESYTVCKSILWPEDQNARTSLRQRAVCEAVVELAALLHIANKGHRPIL